MILALTTQKELDFPEVGKLKIMLRQRQRLSGKIGRYVGKWH